MGYDEATGIHLVAAGGGDAECHATAGPAWHNLMGRVHGGFVAGLADAAMAAAFLSLQPPGQDGTSIDLDVRFLRPVVEGTLVAKARTVKHGARISVLACDVRHGDHLVAVATSQFVRI